VRRGFVLALLVGFLASCAARVPCEKTSPSATPAESTGKELFGALASDAAASGAGPLTVALHSIATEGDRIGAFVDLPHTACALVMAVGSPGVTDVDAFAFDDDGSMLAADESPAPRAVFIVCPPHPDRVYLSAKVASGNGLVAIGTALVDPDKAAAVARAVHARNLGDDTGRLDAWPGLEAKVRARRKLLGSRWDDVRRVALPIDPRAPTRTTVEIEPHKCIDVLATPSEEVASLELVAEGDGGHIVARADQDGRDRTLVLCTASGDSVTLALRPRGAPGIAAIVIGVSVEGAEAEVGRSVRVDHVTATQPLAEERKALGDVLTKSGYGAPKPVAIGDAKVGSRASTDVKLAAECARIDVIGGAPLGPLSAAIWDAQGALVAEAQGGTRATLYACGPARDARIDVEAATRPGPFAIESRSMPAPPTFVSHPLAASRLLERLYGDATVRPAGLEAARVARLSPTTLVKEPIELAAGTCAEIGVALDASNQGFSGVELRLADTGAKSDTISRGRFVTADRACAGTTKRSMTAEIRVTTGDGDGLVLTRDLGD